MTDNHEALLARKRGALAEVDDLLASETDPDRIEALEMDREALAEAVAELEAMGR